MVPCSKAEEVVNALISKTPQMNQQGSPPLVTRVGFDLVEVGNMERSGIYRE
jgi:hypothetical protein